MGKSHTHPYAGSHTSVIRPQCPSATVCMQTCLCGWPFTLHCLCCRVGLLNSSAQGAHNLVRETGRQASERVFLPVRADMLTECCGNAEKWCQDYWGGYAEDETFVEGSLTREEQWGYQHTHTGMLRVSLTCLRLLSRPFRRPQISSKRTFQTQITSH